MEPKFWKKTWRTWHNTAIALGISVAIMTVDELWDYGIGNKLV
jgi:hypothetical protein